MTKPKDRPEKLVKCDLCGYEGPRREFGRAARSVAIQEDGQRVSAMTDGRQPVCLDRVGCVDRTMMLPIIKKISEEIDLALVEAKKKANAETKANKTGRTTYRDTVTLKRGKRLSPAKG